METRGNRSVRGVRAGFRVGVGAEAGRAAVPPRRRLTTSAEVEMVVAETLAVVEG